MFCDCLGCFCNGALWGVLVGFFAIVSCLGFEVAHWGLSVVGVSLLRLFASG